MRAFINAVAKAALDSSVYSGPSFFVVGSVDSSVDEEASVVLLVEVEVSVLLVELIEGAVATVVEVFFWLFSIAGVINMLPNNPTTAKAIEMLRLLLSGFF